MSLISLKNVGKSYSKYDSEWKRIASWFGISSNNGDQNWVLKDINFEIQRGESIGLIGQNGAGKSTLLKIITGVLKANAGSVQVNGHIAAILELGMGFNPDLTGRQNVFHSAGLMGFSAQEINNAMPQIEEFAEVDEYFDQPIRTYSSGMQVRVAFAVATMVRPDVLIIDEALAVGDSYFQHKCFERIREFKEAGTTLIIVTHGLSDVRSLCDRAILLSDGRILRDGEPDEVIDFYNAIIAERESSKLSIEQRRQKNGWVHTEYGTNEACVESMKLLDATTGNPITLAHVGQDLIIETKVKVYAPLSRVVFGHRIMDRAGNLIWGTNTWHTKQVIEDVAEGSCITFRVKFNCRLGPASYGICFGLVSSEDHFENCFHRADNQVVFDVVNVGKPFFIGTNWLDPDIDIQED